MLRKVASSTMPTRQVLKELDVTKSTYYRWRAGTMPRGRSSRKVPWNRLSDGERQRVLAVARGSPASSSRQLAKWITDNDDFSVSEATVYRILKREGLVKRMEVPVPASKEYRHKTTAPHQMWATDASYLLPRARVGLLLHGHGDGRLLKVHPGVEAPDRHDLGFADRDGARCRRPDGNDRGAGAG